MKNVIKVSEKLSKLVCRTGYTMAELSPDGVCLVYLYQPKMPKALKKQKK